MNSRFSGSSGFGSWFGNDPSGSKWQRTTSTCGSRSSTRGSITPAIPFAASTTTLSGAIAAVSTNESTRSTNPVPDVLRDDLAARRRPRHAPRTARSRIS